MVKHHQSLACGLGARLGLAIALLVNAEVLALASYKVVLKDGTVVEAMSKPVSMDSQYIIRTIDNKTYAVPRSQVNLEATEATNQPASQSSPSQFAGVPQQQPVTANHQQVPLSVQAVLPSSHHLSNKDVMDMHGIGLGPDLILAKMKSSACKFDTSVAALKALKASGVPDSVILAMVQPSPVPQPTQLPAVATASETQAQPTGEQQPASGKPRVFITDSQSWEIMGAAAGNSNGFASHTSGGARPQTAEIMKTFGERCPACTVTMKKDRADYIVILEHEGGKKLARRDNKVVVFNKDGDSIYTGSTRSLGNSVKDACEAITNSRR